MRLSCHALNLEDRVFGIEERVAIREDIADLRAAIEAGGPPRRVLHRRLTREVAGSALCVGLVAPIPAFAR